MSAAERPALKIADEPQADVRPAGSIAKRAILHSCGVFLAMRLGLFVLGLVATALLPSSAQNADLPGAVSVPGWAAHAITGGWHNIFTAWERFDGLWFLRIATHGYAAHDGSAAFFPLYPLATRGVSWLLGGHPFAASLIVSNGAFLGALVVMYVLAASELSEDAARRAVTYAAIFPTAFFFLAPYSESLFLLLCLTAFWAGRRRKWPAAAAAGALAALTRNVGLLLVAPLAVEALLQWRERRRPRDLWNLGWSLGPVVGISAYLWYSAVRFGDWLAPLHQQAVWQRGLAAPWTAVTEGTRIAFRFPGTYPGGYHQMDWLVVIPALALAVYAAVRLRPTYSVYVFLTLVVLFLYPFAPRPLMSVPRFLLPLFPIYWALADLTRRRWLPHTLVVAVSAVGLGILTMLFVDWYYVF